jgi:PadR family transcriptional regulator PadR
MFSFSDHIRESVVARDEFDIGPFDQQVMLAVQRLAPGAYGIAIQEEIEKRTGATPTIGKVYAALERLDQRGFTASQYGEPTAVRGGRRKLLVTLTALGQQSLAASLRATDAMRQGTPWQEALA